MKQDLVVVPHSKAPLLGGLHMLIPPISLWNQDCYGLFAFATIPQIVAMLFAENDKQL